MALILDGSLGVPVTTVTGTLPVANGGTGSATNATGFKNRIINGAMVIDQWNAGASVTSIAGYVYSLDRFVLGASQSSKFTVQQNAGAITPPVGFSNYLGATSSSAYTVGAAEQFFIAQRIEGLNVSDLAWGTANASAVTLSFRVYSSLTGTFGGSIINSSMARSYPFSYSIPVANTWTTISITIAGDTTGTWLTTNGIGIQINFSMGAGASSSGTAGAWAGAMYFSATGATSVVGTNGATFYLTGVQLEVGSTATSFEYRPYGTELMLCQRYYQQLASGGDYSSFSSGMCVNTTEAFFFNQFIVPMRSAPSVTPSTLSNFCIYVGASAYTVTSFTNRAGGAVNGNYMSNNLNAVVASGLTAGYGAMLMNATSTNVTLAFSSEL